MSADHPKWAGKPDATRPANARTSSKSNALLTWSLVYPSAVHAKRVSIGSSETCRVRCGGWARRFAKKEHVMTTQNIDHSLTFMIASLIISVWECISNYRRPGLDVRSIIATTLWLILQSRLTLVAGVRGRSSGGLLRRSSSFLGSHFALFGYLR